MFPFYYLCFINYHDIIEELRYFYHPDHLGSSSRISDRDGNAIQHLMYMPFGEDWINQRNSSWNSTYTFSAKEKDVETGYNYFGARYYNSGLSIWLSVDPMSDGRPWLSPYNYCQNSPIGKIDKDGRFDTDWGLKPTGEIVQIGETNNNPDVLFFLDQNGNKTTDRKGNEQKIELGGKIKVYNAKNMYTNYSKPQTFIQFESFEDGKKMFEGMYSFTKRNSKNEYCFYGYRFENNDYFVMCTSYEQGSVISEIPLLFAEKGELYFDYHYHFEGCYQSSHVTNGHDADREFGEKVRLHSPNVQLGIYLNHVLHSYECEKLNFWK